MNNSDNKNICDASYWSIDKKMEDEDIIFFKESLVNKYKKYMEYKINEIGKNGNITLRKMYRIEKSYAFLILKGK